MGSLLQAYQTVYYNEQELREEVAEFCNEFFFDTVEETEYFVEELFKDEDIVLEFFDDVLSFTSEFQLNEEAYITEIRSALIKHGLRIGGGLLKKASPAVRGMSAKTLSKQGIQAGGVTKAGKLLSQVNKPALATQTKAIQTARAVRKADMPKVQEPNKYLNMLQQKRASRGLPAAGQTTAGTSKAKTERGWLRHRVAVDQANTVATAFMKTMDDSAKAAAKAQRTALASTKLATAAKGTKNIGPAIPATGGAPGGKVVSANARRTAAKDKAARAAAGTKGTGTTNAYPGPEARNQTVDVSATTVSSRRTTRDRARQVGRELKNNKTAAAVALATGAAAYGLTSSGLDSTRKKIDLNNPPTTLADKTPPETKAPETPKTPETPKAPPAPKAPETPKVTPAPKAPETPKAPPAPKAPETPKVTPAPKAPKGPSTPPPVPTGTETTKSSVKKMTKIDRDTREIMNMRARSLERQGRARDAKELRDRIAKKYAGYED